MKTSNSFLTQLSEPQANNKNVSLELVYNKGFESHGMGTRAENAAFFGWWYMKGMLKWVASWENGSISSCCRSLLGSFCVHVLLKTMLIHLYWTTRSNCFLLHDYFTMDTSFILWFCLYYLNKSTVSSEKMVLHVLERVLTVAWPPEPADKCQKMAQSNCQLRRTVTFINKWFSFLSQIFH